MLQTLRKRFERDEEGFTLIELMVVVLIIAILLAIAIPTFLGARERAQDRAAQSNLRNAYTAAKAVYTDTEDYAGVTADELATSEPTLVFKTAAGVALTKSTEAKEIVFATASTVDPAATHEQIIMAALSKSGKCFKIKEVVGTSGATTGGVGAGTFYGVSTTGDCVPSGTVASSKW